VKRPGALPLATLLLAAALVTRPLIHGVEPATLLAFWAVVLGQCVLPGVIVARAARLVDGRDRVLLVGQGATLGLALQGLSVLAGRALGWHGLPSLVAVVAVGFGIALGRRRGPAAPPTGTNTAPATAGADAATLAVALVAALLLPLTSAARPGGPIAFDILFHGGNAAELRHRWPLEDPRVAGVPLHYHLLAYALPVAAADLASGPVADTLFTLAPQLWLVLLALQLRNAGGALFADARAGAVAAAIVLFHADAGRVLGLEDGAFNSYLSTGLYGSPTTLFGLVLLAGLALSLHAFVERGERRQLGALGLLAAAASAAKTTVLPVVVAALALSALGLAWRRRPVAARRFAAALAVTAFAGAPFTLWQNVGAESYSTMARLGFAAAFTSSAFADTLQQSFGPGAVGGPLAVPAFGLWLVGYLGLAGIAAALWLFRHAGEATSLQTWALGVGAISLAASLVVSAPGLSQLFLLYNGQLLLALFAGAAFVEASARPRRLADGLRITLLALATIPALDHVAVALPELLDQDRESAAYVRQPVEREYAAGLAWLRAHAAADAVVWADNPSLLLSALGEVRLYYENGTYSARAWRVPEGEDPWPERTALQERVLRHPDAQVLAQARRAMGPGRRLLIVADSVQSSVDDGIVGPTLGPVSQRRLFPESLFDLRFVNGAMQVYEAR
jgi:hypothetical protein